MVGFQLWSFWEDSLAERTLVDLMDPPVFSYTAQAEDVSTRKEDRADELIQTDAARR